MRVPTLLITIVTAVACTGQSLSGGAGAIGGSGGGSLVGDLLVGAVNGLMQPEEFMNDEAVDHARDIETRLLFGMGITLQAATLTGKTGQAETAVYPWLGLRFDAGTSFTYRDRVMLSLNGGWGVNGYMLRLDSMLNSIYHTNTNAEVRLAWHTLPKRNVFTQWSFGMGFGGTFQQADDRTTERDGFLAFTQAPRLERPYVAPELGRFTASGKDRFEVTLRYVKHLDPAPAWTSESSFNGSTASYEASDDHLALMMRYHLGFRKEVPALPAVAAPLEHAGQDTLPGLACKRQRVTLKLWDDAEVDGDTVSVLLNGEPVLARECLRHRPVKLRLDLGYGHNFVEVIAHNEGRIPPNTARGILRRGKGREALLIKTTRKRGETLVLVRG
jgi:hypothetical protein